MNQDPTATTTKDSTSNGTNLTTHGTLASATGKIGNAVSFDGSTGYMTSGVTINSATFTTSAWVSITDLLNSNRYIYFEDGADGRNMGFYLSNGTFWVFNHPLTGTAAIANTLYKLDYVYTGGQGTLYVNGTAGSATTYTPDAGGNLCIGCYANSASYTWKGIIDDFRYSNTNRSADWIKTEYNNQNSPSTFYTMGAETANGGGGTTVHTLSSLGAGN
jgi:hypothetical protein